MHTKYALYVMYTIPYTHTHTCISFEWILLFGRVFSFPFIYSSFFSIPFKNYKKVLKANIREQKKKKIAERERKRINTIHHEPRKGDQALLP